MNTAAVKIREKIDIHRDAITWQRFKIIENKRILGLNNT
jgi:hypothetical protein